MAAEDEKAKILIIDDVPANVKILIDTLQSEYMTFSATNGEDALKIASSSIPDLVLLDIMMPGMNGYEVCRRLKADPLLKDIPVIFITAMGDEENEKNGLELGAVDYIAKPFKPALVKLRVRNHLKSKRQRDILARLNYIDPLTGIANRRAFDEYFHREWRRASRSSTTLSAILIDIDQFKLYNDNYGHIPGDDCLRNVAKAISGTLQRPADLAARYGGEEFVCLLPDTDSNGACLIAEKVRANVAALAIPHAHSSVAAHVTISAGVATIHPSQTAPAASLIEAADRMLYQAKQEGRNMKKFILIE